MHLIHLNYPIVFFSLKKKVPDTSLVPLPYDLLLPKAAHYIRISSPSLTDPNPVIKTHIRILQSKHKMTPKYGTAQVSNSYQLDTFSTRYDATLICISDI